MAYSTEILNRNNYIFIIVSNDFKRENILLIDDTLKLADLGSCRGIYSK